VGAGIQRDDPSSRITSVLSRLEIARRNIIAAHFLLDNKNISPIAEYTSISHVYEPLNKLLTMLLPHLKFDKGYCFITDFLVVLFLGFEPMIRLPMEIYILISLVIILK
jgi:hypothetical protein